MSMHAETRHRRRAERTQNPHRRDLDFAHSHEAFMLGTKLAAELAPVLEAGGRYVPIVVVPRVPWGIAKLESDVREVLSEQGFSGTNVFQSEAGVGLSRASRTTLFELAKLDRVAAIELGTYSG